jgi:hypothetical protein
VTAARSVRTRLVGVMTPVNTVLLVGLVVLARSPEGFAQQLGLWHGCEITPPATTGTSGWHWPILLALVPFAVGVDLGARTRDISLLDDHAAAARRSSRILLAVSVAGIILLAVMWFLPLQTCIT